MTTTAPQADVAEIRRALDLLAVPGGIVEIRAPDVPIGRGKPITVAGYFSDLDKAAQAAADLDARKAPCVYLVLNQAHPGLIARSPNQLTENPKHTTSDNDILRRRWLPLDFDAIRPAGISATEDEHCAAEDVARQCAAWLAGLGWPEAIQGDSGNGAHLLYRVDLPNDEASCNLVRNTLAALADRFDRPEIKIDRSVFNAARIWKCYGTTAGKGHSIAERPHRPAQLVNVPERVEVVAVEKLEAVAATVAKPETPRPSTSGNGQFNHRLDVPRWLTDRGFSYRVKDRHDQHDRTVYILDTCPFDKGHGKGGEVSVMQGPDGKLAAACMHNSCTGRGWQQFKEAIGPPDDGHYDPPLHQGNGQAKLGKKVSPTSDAKPAEPPALPAIQDAYTLCAADLPLPPEIVQGVLHRGSKLSLGAMSKGFTTWTLLLLGLCVGYGLPWLGCQTAQARVLFVNLEIQPAFIRRRLNVLTDALGIDQEPDHLDIWNLRGHAASHQEIFPRIIERIGGGGYGIVVLDPIYKLYGAGDNENGAREIAGLMNSIETLAVKTGAAVAFRAHYSKGNQAGKEAIDRVSGSGVFARDPDSLLNFTVTRRPTATPWRRRCGTSRRWPRSWCAGNTRYSRVTRV